MISIGDARGYEGTGAGTTAFHFDIRSSGCSAATVRYSTINGTATAGPDYAATSGSLSLPAGTNDKVVSVPIARDAADETNEYFKMKLSLVSGSASFATDAAFGRILDDDGPLKWNVDDSSCTEGDPGITTSCGIRITMSKAQPAAVTVHLSTANGNAIAPSDYLAVTNATVTMPAGTTATARFVKLTNDQKCEGLEHFNVSLSAPSAGVLADGTAIVTIADDDFFCPPS